jgi:hypothetical protein
MKWMQPDLIRNEDQLLSFREIFHECSSKYFAKIRVTYSFWILFRENDSDDLHATFGLSI